MGAHFYAYTVVGVLIPRKKCFEPVTVKAFEHNHPANWQVDPVSGAKLWKTTQQFLLEGIDEPNRTNPYTIAYHSTCHDDGDFAVGYLSCGDAEGKNGFLKPDINLENIKTELKGFLEAVGLWNESNFGIHTFCYCSY